VKALLPSFTRDRSLGLFFVPLFSPSSAFALVHFFFLRLVMFTPDPLVLPFAFPFFYGPLCCCAFFVFVLRWFADGGLLVFPGEKFLQFFGCFFFPSIRGCA